MKSLRAVLFALVVLPLAACGGDRDVPTPTETSMPPIVQRAPELPVVVEPVKPPVVAVEAPLEIPAKYVDALALGKELAAKGDVRAKDVFEAAAKLDKKKAEPHIELARMFITKGERGNAVKSAKKAVKLAPESSQAYNTLGRAELMAFNYDNAIEAFTKATVLNPDNVFAWNNLGYTHVQLQEYIEAVAALTEATSRPGATGYMWNNLGTAHEHLDELDEARVAFERGGQLGSTEAKASRKRLEGVDTIVVMKTEPVEKSYELREEMPEDVDTVEDTVTDETKVEEPTTVEPAKVEPTAVEPAKVDAPVTETPPLEVPVAPVVPLT